VQINLSDAIAAGIIIAAPCLAYTDPRHVIVLSVFAGLAWLAARAFEGF
jgi:hypothetical protein